MINITQDKIISNWQQKDFLVPQVSIMCLVYNHEQYVEDCLDGLLMQETLFPFEILVHDDASTDGTRKIVEKYVEKYPLIVKPVFEDENQYSKKVSITKDIMFPRIKSKYIAFCEGDDFWTDKDKLQKQFDILENNPNINMCAHAAKVLDGDKYIYEIKPINHEGIISTNQVIEDGGGILATNSLFYRKSLLDNQPNFYKQLTYDYTLEILGSIGFGIYYLPESMSVYRYFSSGSWSSKHKDGNDKLSKHIDRIISMLNVLDTEYKGVYSKAIQNRINKLELIRNDFNGNLLMLKNKNIRKHFLKLPIKNKVAYIKEFVREKIKHE